MMERMGIDSATINELMNLLIDIAMRASAPLPQIFKFADHQKTKGECLRTPKKYEQYIRKTKKKKQGRATHGRKGTGPSSNKHGRS